jgi:O-antigen/teichoic acid export membrane protein
MVDTRDSSGLGRLVSGGAWFLGFMVLSGAFYLVWGVVVSRVYGPVGYGVWSMAQSVFDFVWAFSFGGVFEGLIHFGAGYLAKPGANLSRYFSDYVRYLTGLGGVLCVVFAVVAVQVTDVVVRIVLLSLAFAFLFSGLKDGLASIIGAQQRSKHLSTLNSARFLAVLLFGGVLILLDQPFRRLPILVFVATAGQLLLCLFYVRPYFTALVRHNVAFFRRLNLRRTLLDDLRRLRHLFVFGFFVSMRKIAFNVMKSLDITVLKLFFDYADVGVYSAADAASSILFSMAAFSLPIISSISTAWTTQDHALLERHVRIAVKYPLLIGVPLTAIILTLASPIVVGIYGPAFRDAIVPLQILIVGTFLLMFGYTLSSILIGVGKPRIPGVLMAGAAAQYILSLFLLTPVLGFEGAAIALTLTGVTSLILLPFFIRDTLRINVFAGIHKVLFAGAALAAVLLLIASASLPLLAAGTVAGVVLYVALLRYTGYISQEDVDVLKSLRGNS